MSNQNREPSIPFDPFKVTNYANWGKLVKAWSLGQIALPQSLAESKEQCRELKAGEHLPHSIKAVQFVQSRSHTHKGISKLRVL